MVGIKNLFGRKPILGYLVMAYGFSWVLWAGLIATTPLGAMQEGITPMFIATAIVGGFGPSVAGIIATWLTDGGEGLRALFRRVRRWRVGGRWYLAALGFTPAVALITLAIERWYGVPTATWDEMLASLPISVIWPLFAAVGEELGWRGFMLPRLQERQTALGSAILVGLAWGGWHIPTIYLAYGQFGWMVVLAYVIVVHVFAIVAQSTVMTWVHNSAGQSLLLAILFHITLTGAAQFAFPLTLGVAEGLRHQFVYGLVYWIGAAAVIRLAGHERLRSSADDAD